MTDFIVHTVPGSPYGRSAMIALEEKGAVWRLAPLGPGEARAQAHLARHPFGKIPALEHGDFTLYETQAIVRYVDRVLPENPLTPPDPRGAAGMDQVMNVNDWYLYKGGGAVIGFERVVKPKLLGMASDEAAVAAALPAVHQVFEVLSRQLGDAPFLIGDRFTLADVMVGPQLELLSRTPEWSALSSGRPNLAAYLERLETRPSFRATKWERLLELLQPA